jgi:hypothetical protein
VTVKINYSLTEISTGAGPRIEARRLHPRREVGEPGVVQLVGDRDGAGLAVAVLGNDQVGLTGPRILRAPGIGPVHQDHQVGVLLQRTGLPKIRQQRAFVGALLRITCAFARRSEPQQYDIVGALSDEARARFTDEQLRIIGRD